MIAEKLIRSKTSGSSPVPLILRQSSGLRTGLLVDGNEQACPELCRRDSLPTLLNHQLSINQM